MAVIVPYSTPPFCRRMKLVKPQAELHIALDLGVRQIHFFFGMIVRWARLLYRLYSHIDITHLRGCTTFMMAQDGTLDDCYMLFHHKQLTRLGQSLYTQMSQIGLFEGIHRMVTLLPSQLGSQSILAINVRIHIG